MSSNGFFGEIESTDLEDFGVLIQDSDLPDSYDKTETFDAFNDDTFGAPIEGDWESEHDKLMTLENDNNGFDGTLTKFEDFEGKFIGSDEYDEAGSERTSRDDSNGIQSNYMNEMQLKLFQQQQQLMFQQQQLLKNQRVQQHQPKQYHPISNSATSISPPFPINNDHKLLQQQQQQVLAAMMLRNNAHIQQNSIYNSLPITGNNIDMNDQHQTPVNMKMNEINNDHSNNLQDNLNVIGNMKTTTSGSDSQKIKNFLEKIMPLQPPGVGNSNAMTLPKLSATKVKTLEEIENELLACDQPKKSTDSSAQKNSMESPQNNQNLNKFFSMLNNNQAGNQLINNIDCDVNSTQMLMLKQKQLLDQFEFSQKQALLQQQKQQSLLNTGSDQQHQLMLMQQQLMSQMNLSAFLPPNFQSFNQQQKQLVLAQIQRNMQLSMMQQPQNNNNQRQNNDIENLILNNDLNNNRYNENTMKQRSNGNMMNNGNNNNSRNMVYGNQGRNNNNNNGQARNNNRSNSRNNSFNGDKLAGMMTDKEKNWVTNVQMLQLQIDDPYRYDFYYTAWMLKKKQFSQRNASSATLKTSVIHSLDNKYNNNKDHLPNKTYRPLIFENSLGKVTMSNFHHPRALIDVRSGEDACDTLLCGQIGELDLDEKTGGIDKEKNIDTILLEIEKMYKMLLHIDEIEHAILKASEEMRAVLFQERRTKVDKLALMLCTENFAHYLFIDKGKRLLGKCIPTFNLAQTKLILTFIMQYTYIIAKNSICLDDLYSHISYAIDTQKFADLVEIVNPFVTIYSRYSEKTNQTIFSNKFCLSFLLKFFSKSDLISQDDFEPEHKAIWSCFLNMVLAGVAVIKPVSVSSDGTPVYNVCENIQMNLDTIIDNFDVDQQVWSKNERKLKHLFI